MHREKPSTPFRSRADVSPLFRSVFQRFEAPGRLLDLGCNTGRELSYAAQHGWIAEGCDTDAQAIVEARQRFVEERTTNVSAYILSIQECLQQTPYRYTLVSSIDVLSFLSPQDVRAVLHGIDTVLKPGGIVLLRVFTTLEPVVTKRPDRTFFEAGHIAQAFPAYGVLENYRGRFADPGHVGRPEPHEHHVEVFVAQKQ